MVSELIGARPWATEAGTARFVARHGVGRAADAWTQIARLELSSIGIGTYLGPSDDATDASYLAAVVDAVRRGVNVIDTAASYRHGRSERVVGRALAELQAMGEIYRSEVLIASKAGFVTADGQAPADPLAHALAATVGAGLAEADELSCGCHCMAPDYLAETVKRSLQRLDIKTLDVCFIHNPECQLQQLGRATVMARLRRAFVALERLADEGHLRVYGLATWTGLRARPHERDWLGLADVVALAEEVAGSRHRFRAIELPFNAAMPEALTRHNQVVDGEACCALEAARRLGMVTFVGGPLMQGRLANEDPGQAHDALQLARSAPGVSSALVGMSDLEHVRRNTAVMAEPRLSPAQVSARLSAA